MPTVIRFGRFHFIIYPQDHRPKHVHIWAASAKAKFDIQTGECLAVFGFSQKTIKRLSELVLKHKPLLLEVWEKYDGEED